MTIRSLLVFAAFAAMLGSPTFAETTSSTYRPPAIDITRAKGLPPLGKWMITPDFQPAHWLGAKWRNRSFREPINVIVIDKASKTADEAKKKFEAACAKAGFPSRMGHSGGYWGWMGNRLQPQVPSEPGHAFSDEPFELTNNHGRFFGPYQHDGRFYFIGALSREKVAPLAEVKHHYVSFNAARDAFADSLDNKTDYKLTGFRNLDNAFIGHAELTTGDHDGVATILELKR